MYTAICVPYTRALWLSYLLVIHHIVQLKWLYHTGDFHAVSMLVAYDGDGEQVVAAGRPRPAQHHLKQTQSLLIIHTHIY